MKGLQGLFRPRNWMILSSPGPGLFGQVRHFWVACVHQPPRTCHDGYGVHLYSTKYKVSYDSDHLISYKEYLPWQTVYTFTSLFLIFFVYHIRSGGL